MNNRITVKNGIEKKNWVPALNNTDFNHFSSDIFPDNIGCYFLLFFPLPRQIPSAEMIKIYEQ